MLVLFYATPSLHLYTCTPLSGVSITFGVGACVSQSKRHYKGLSENQATVAGAERQICDNKDGDIPLAAGF